ncbi:hypothetical protein DFA_04460 [Cavenderia fasciculata]|uniref:F-box domain-containing protein n=1 Tax=Cavenderia fasciculata TaxID=261658 RepID=F4PPM9_CACFS|nr:uncharacterized protein DFA_04460 [Cavenderia fasciculata]EGG22342.1 hypothetical protein DFA_04460 [Cavenderia fasciculata]|eukprot:XP_004360193.1 hypothetical protein DFA_04460 [Cavenderia fasciculata]
MTTFSNLIIKEIILDCVGGDRYLLSFPFPFVCKTWNQIIQNDDFWRKLCFERWSSLSILPEDYQIETYGGNSNKYKSWFGSEYDAYYGSSFHFLGIDVNCWKDLFKFRYNRSAHLRFIKNGYIPFYLKNDQGLEEMLHSIGIVKQMAPLDESILDDYRNRQETMNLFLLESVCYESIREIDRQMKHTHEYFLDCNGSFMDFSGKCVKFSYQFEDYNQDSDKTSGHIKVGSCIYDSDKNHSIPDFWESVQKEIGFESTMEDLQSLFAKIMVPRTKELEAHGFDVFVSCYLQDCF